MWKSYRSHENSICSMPPIKWYWLGILLIPGKLLANSCSIVSFGVSLYMYTMTLYAISLCFFSFHFFLFFAFVLRSRWENTNINVYLWRLINGIAHCVVGWICIDRFFIVRLSDKIDENVYASCVGFVIFTTNGSAQKFDWKQVTSSLFFSFCMFRKFHYRFTERWFNLQVIRSILYNGMD